MSVVQLPGGEIQPAMKSGLIDAAEFNNPTSDKDFGMQDVSKHYHLGSFHQSQEAFESHLQQEPVQQARRKSSRRYWNMPPKPLPRTLPGSTRTVTPMT